MCDFVFDPDLWPREIDTFDQPWECPYPAFEDYTVCVFHLFPETRHEELPTREERRSAYLQTVAAIGEVDLVCVTLDQLPLGQLLASSDTHVAQICFSEISEGCQCERVPDDTPVYFYQTSIEELNLNNARVRSDFSIQQSNINKIQCYDTTFEELAWFESSQFDKADFRESLFLGPAYWSQPSSLASPSETPDAEYLGSEPCSFEQVAFNGATFEERAVFTGVQVEEWASFLFTNFEYLALFNNFDGGVVTVYREATFNKASSFEESELGVCDFRSTEFRESVDFTAAIFGNEQSLTEIRGRVKHSLSEGYPTTKQWLVEPTTTALELSTNEIGGISAVFDSCEFGGMTRLWEVTLRHGMSARDVTVSGELEIKLQVDYPVPVMFHNSEIDEGKIAITDGPELYELSRARIGSVDLVGENGINPFTRILFDETTFAGFDFRNYRELLRQLNWDIHSIDLDVEGENPRMRSPSATRGEATFSKAKTGAISVGDTHAASEFFVRESRFRRRHHQQTINRADGLQKLDGMYRYTANWLFDVSCRYAESPGRVLLWSLGFVAIFSGIYGALGLNLALINDSDTVLINAITAYLIFSLQSFTSFLLPGGTAVSSTLIRFIATLESFIGAFSIGLFIATLVRTVER